MSREFGCYEAGYFHAQMAHARDDLAGGDQESTRIWAKFFAVFYPVAYAIASVEAGDSSPPFTVTAAVKQLPELRKALDEIEDFFAPYRAVMEEAAREALERTMKKAAP